MNRLPLIMKERSSFSFCYRYISLLSRDTTFHQIPKKNLFLPLVHRESLTSLSHDRHVSMFTRLKTGLKNSLADSTAHVKLFIKKFILAFSAIARCRLEQFIFYICQAKVRIAGNLVYEKIVDDLDYKSFFKCFELPDTFQSWFLFIQIHIWMVVITTVSERHGREFRNSLVDCMWHDVEIRMGHLGKMKSSLKKKYLKDLVSQFQAALISYDEGILSDDTVLAAAAWRTIFACKRVEPELLENIVIYMRRQLAHLDTEPAEKIIIHGSISFLPLHTILSDSKE